MSKFIKNIKTRFFVIFILLFPIIIKVLLHITTLGLTNINWNFIEILKSTVSIINENMSFYATALTITFTVYSFNKQQEKYEEERQKEFEKLQIEQEKANELKVKELEAQKDYYRPTFIVEDNGTGTKFIKVIMRNENLYLEQLRYYDMSEYGVYSFTKMSLKSGDTLTNRKVNSFYITAKTQIGETILFGYLNSGVKIYKYLRDGDRARYPLFNPIEYDQEEVDKIWGTYNNGINDVDNNIERIFFYNTRSIRELLLPKYSNFFTKTFNAKSVDEFIKSVFQEILDGLKSEDILIKSVADAIVPILKYIKENNNKIMLDSLRTSDYSHLYQQIIEFKYHKNLLEDEDFTINSFLTQVIDLFQQIPKDASNTYKTILRILISFFKCIEVDKSLDDKLYDLKTTVLNNIEIEKKL